MEEAENGARKQRSATRVPGNGERKLSPPTTKENGARKQRSPTRAPGNGERNLPSSPRPPRSEQTKPSAAPPPPPPGVPKWLILDRFVHRSSRKHCGVVEEDATASTLALDCVDRPVRASLRIADPPAVSRLYLHLTGRPEIPDCREPVAIAAHRNSILFRMAVPFVESSWWSRPVYFPEDYFVYSCSSSSPPSLTLLPPCFDGGSIDPEFDKFFQPHRYQQQRVMLDEAMGILCHGDQGEFTVADLSHRSYDDVSLCLLHHPPPASAIPMKWTVKKLQIPPGMNIDLSSFRIDVVVPIGDRCLCWVDYYHGLLLVDVLADSKSHPDQELLHYIPLPSQPMKSGRLYKDAGEYDPLRCLCVTDSGIIKLVCILTKSPPDDDDPFTIITWILDDVHQGKWTKDVDTTMGAEKFFSLLGTGQSCLPRVKPSFPVVSLVDPDVFCFLLDDNERGLFWMVQVNMKKKELLSSTLYVNEEEEEGYPSKRGRRYRFFGHYFILSKFSSYLSEDAITSRNLSETMQKAKEESALGKSGLKSCRGARHSNFRKKKKSGRKNK